MEEGFEHIKLINSPPVIHSQYEGHTNGSNLVHWIEGFSVVQALLLLVALTDESNFITSNCTMKLVFDNKHPT